MAKHDIGELITELNDAVNKLNNLRAKYDDLEKERDALKLKLTGITLEEDTQAALETFRHALKGKGNE